MSQDAKTPTRIIPALGRIYDPLTHYTYPLIRFVTDAMLIPHGWAKLVSGSPAGLAQSLAKMGMEPAYSLAVYVGMLELERIADRWNR